MSAIVAKKSAQYHLALPAIDKAAPELYITGETVIDEAYTKTGSAPWSAIGLADSMLEIGVTGIYEITITAGEMTADKLLIKFTSAGMADDAVMFDLRSKFVEDLNDFDPALDTVLLVDTVLNIPSTTPPPAAPPPGGTTPLEGSGRVAAILLNVRDSLSDQDAERYTEDRLLRLLDKAQKDLNIRARILRDKFVISQVPGLSIYSVPAPTRLLGRISNLDGRVEMLTHEEAEDRFGPEWEEDIGKKLKAIIYDKQNQAFLKTYPIAEEPSGEDTLYDYVSDSELGEIITVEGFDTIDDYGIVAGPDHDTTYSSDLGLASILVENFDGLLVNIHTFTNPVTLTIAVDPDTNEFIFSNLEIPETYDIALEHYVTGIAFRDDVDSQNRDLGKEHLALYADLVQQAISDAARDSTQNPRIGNNLPPKYNTVI